MIPLKPEIENLLGSVKVTEESIKVTRLSGNDLQHFGINDGDLIIYQTNTKFDENDLSVWREQNTENHLAGFGYENFGEVSITNYNGKLSRYKKKEIEHIGTFIAILKPFSAPKLDDLQYEK